VIATQNAIYLLAIILEGYLSYIRFTLLALSLFVSGLCTGTVAL